jgi:transcriptional regulator
MHIPAHNAETRPEALHAFIRANPLGVLTTAIPSSTYPLLQASHIPWVLDSDSRDSHCSHHEEPNSHGHRQPLGRLRGHIARQNPQAKAIIESLTSSTTSTSGPSGGINGPQGSPLPLGEREEVLILFNGPLHHYVTPHFYTSTKPATGRVVPTWNYEAVEVYGRARIFADSKSEESAAFLTKQLHDLSHQSEVAIMGYVSREPEPEPRAGDAEEHHAEASSEARDPAAAGKDSQGDSQGWPAAPAAKKEWRVSDAPDRYIELMMKNIIGIEVEITRIAGRFKWSQEKPVGDRTGVLEGFREMGKGDVGAGLAGKVGEWAERFDAGREKRGEGLAGR